MLQVADVQNLMKSRIDFRLISVILEKLIGAAVHGKVQHTCTTSMQELL